MTIQGENQGMTLFNGKGNGARFGAERSGASLVDAQVEGATTKRDEAISIVQLSSVLATVW